MVTAQCFLHAGRFAYAMTGSLEMQIMERRMIFRDETITEEVEAKALILVDALPYIRDFNQKIIVICFEGSRLLSDEEEKETMRDIALLKSIGMRPVVVHDSKMGHDKFRYNKLVAKMIEMSGIKAVGLCGIDLQTLHITLDNDYIPVITPNDIDNEDTPISPDLCAAEIACSLQAEKLIFMSSISGLHDPESGELIGQIRYTDFKAKEQVCGEVGKKAEYTARLLEEGIPRVHFIDARIRHSLLLELFSIRGVGTAVLPDKPHYYPHERRGTAVS